MKKLFIVLSVALMCMNVACFKEEDGPENNGNNNPVATNIGITEDGAVDAIFSIGENTQVRFSRGNLQYNASTSTWRFAENQYDFIGANNENISASYDGWIDLLGWGTSGWESEAQSYLPYATSYSCSDYYPGGDYHNNLVGDYANADWGVFNAIVNGGNAAGMWRTMTSDEWYYLLSERNNAFDLRGFATIGDVAGLVILPDNWVSSDSCSFISGTEDAYTTNVYTNEEWLSMQRNGAVFLPAAGLRDGVVVYRSNKVGRYWSSINWDDETYSYSLCFDEDDDGLCVRPMDHCDRNFGLSVRLVQVVR